MSFENQNSKENTEAPQEKKDYLKQAESLIPDRFKKDYFEMKALFDDGEKRNILERQLGNPKKALELAAFVVEKKDPLLLRDYMSQLDPADSNSMGADAQIALLEAADKSSGANGSLNNPESTNRGFDETVATYKDIDKKLPYTNEALFKDYEEKLMNGYYSRNVPAKVAALPHEAQKQIYHMNPEGFARSFPDSGIVQEDTLQILVDQDIHLVSKTAMDLRDSYSGRNASILRNPNLSSKQLAQITDAFVQIGYDANPERNPNYFEATQNVLRAYNAIKDHPNTSPATKKKLQDRFDKALGR